MPGIAGKADIRAGSPGTKRSAQAEIIRIHNHRVGGRLGWLAGYRAVSVNRRGSAGGRQLMEVGRRRSVGEGQQEEAKEDGGGEEGGGEGGRRRDEDGRGVGRR